MELIDEGIRLRPLRYADRERLAVLASNKKIWRNLRDIFPYPYTLADADKFIDMVKLQEPQVTFAIENNHQFVGVIGLVLQADVYRKSAEIGYWLGEPFWNKGITTTAVKLATNYAFETLGLERLYAGVFESNTGSKKVLEKCGFFLEGIARKAIYKDNKWMDEYRFGKVKSDN